MPRDSAALLDIVKAARLVIEFTGGMDQDTFLQDAKTQSAVLHQLLILGEAVKRLSGEFRASHPAIPWALIAGMRDTLIHEYNAVDLYEVWRTAQRDVPELLRYVEALIPVDEGEGLATEV
jgi:uncharacterized protein with HEPN domain